MAIQRRTLIRAAAGVAAAATVAPVLAQARTKVKVGYLHTPAVDGHIWLGQQSGGFAKQGLELELVQFTTGLELFQAMIGGSLDVLATGAVLSNFPARGQGKVFLLNNIEYATAQLWVRGDAGIASLADLKGKQIATTTGTTAHVFLDRALRSAQLDPARDVRIVNQRMAEAVTSFISGAVPAVALWSPFDSTVRQKATGARKLIDASAFFPQAAIMGGWAARNDYYEKNKATLRKLVAAWVPVNDHIVNNPDAAAEALQKTQYKEVPLAEFKEQFKASKYYSSPDWRVKYADGTATRWLQQVTDFFVQNANIANAVKAEQYFDPSIFNEVVKA
ncbi:NitT/TauT family transport system substrate-binding protein [Variovorax boronicumulans]|uniref:NitT/TauT family transport system substrate-binding protein n=1 Tax=Variovorax boronicumulans TaxID=436515 RepID=A0AAW8E2C2_9BURK|nr:ABC transporter substrate-binding protein [Variovorax boronicumulans]MDP9880696.1 NitT/TauT family transport system substrate-binding protein [Variovorax boronicumulans]MDP9920237.1 NitT/TauT family transport system substrate-binding protein [Variovorax boronicumulans]MDP9925983.1 NitT/TauT family transport system substrate-binding protein [Variovorax boronicumulans]